MRQIRCASKHITGICVRNFIILESLIDTVQPILSIHQRDNLNWLLKADAC